VLSLSDAGRSNVGDADDRLMTRQQLNQRTLTPPAFSDCENTAKYLLQNKLPANNPLTAKAQKNDIMQTLPGASITVPFLRRIDVIGAP